MLPRGYENKIQVISWERTGVRRCVSEKRGTACLDLVYGTACGLRDGLKERVHDECEM